MITLSNLKNYDTIKTAEFTEKKYKNGKFNNYIKKVKKMISNYLCKKGEFKEVGINQY